VAYTVEETRNREQEGAFNMPASILNHTKFWFSQTLNLEAFIGLKLHN